MSVVPPGGMPWVATGADSHPEEVLVQVAGRLNAVDDYAQSVGWGIGVCLEKWR